MFKYFENFKRELEREKEKLRLEDKIMRFVRKVSELQEEQPKLAHRYLIQATKLYHGEFNGLLPNRGNDKEYNKIFISFFNAYPPKIIRESNPALI